MFDEGAGYVAYVALNLVVMVLRIAKNASQVMF